jgi:hypothetical protein
VALGVAALGMAGATRLLVFVDAETLFAYAAIPAGLLAGVITSAIVGRPRMPLTHSLEAAGVMGLAALASVLLDTSARLRPPMDSQGEFALALSHIAALAAGTALAARSPRPLRDATVLATALVGIGLVTLARPLMGDAARDPRNAAALLVRFTAALVLVVSAWLGRTFYRRNDPA